jgi:hypothetical protein
MKKGAYTYEKNLSTKPEQKEEGSWVPEAHEHQERQKGH